MTEAYSKWGLTDAIYNCLNIDWSRYVDFTFINIEGHLPLGCPSTSFDFFL